MAYLQSFQNELNAQKQAIFNKINSILTDVQRQPYPVNDNTIKQDAESFVQDKVRKALQSNASQKNNRLQKAILEKLSRKEHTIRLNDNYFVDNKDLKSFLDPRNEKKFDLPQNIVFYELSENQPAFVPVPNMFFDMVYILVYAAIALAGMLFMLLAAWGIHFVFGVAL